MHVLVPIIARLHDQHPRVLVDVQRMSSRQIATALADGSIDFGVLTFDPKQSELKYVSLGRDELVLLVPAGHPLSKRRVAIGDLDGQRFVLPPPGRPQRTTLDAAFAAASIGIREGALAVGWELVVHLVSVGAGIAIVNGSVRLPRGLVARPLPELPRVRYRAFTRPRLSAPIMERMCSM